MTKLVMVALAPSLLWLWWFRRQEATDREPAGALARAFLWGAAAVVPAALVELLLVPGAKGTFLECLFLIGPIEELAKFLATRRAVAREPAFDSPADGIVYAAAVSLGFAFGENLGYFAGFSMITIAVRSVLSVPGHVLFAVFWGAALGRVRWVPGTSRLELAGGVCAASLLHGLYDALLFNVDVAPALYLILFAALVGIQWKMYRQLMDEAEARGVQLGCAGPVVAAAEPAAGAEIVALPGPPALEWTWVWKTFGLGCGVSFGLSLLLALWTPIRPGADQDGALGALAILGLVLAGVISGYRSPGRTIRESALGLAILGGLAGLAIGSGAAGTLVSSATLALLGGFGGWLGEALQDARAAP